MPWIDLTVRCGTLTKDVQHAVMAKPSTQREDVLQHCELIDERAARPIGGSALPGIVRCGWADVRRRAFHSMDHD